MQRGTEFRAIFVKPQMRRYIKRTSNAYCRIDEETKRILHSAVELELEKLIHG